MPPALQAGSQRRQQINAASKNMFRAFELELELWLQRCVCWLTSRILKSEGNTP
jgi:hypothetical protein